jgi:hypothetical protein
MLQSGTIRVNFRFGVTIALINISQEHLIRDNELYYINGFDGVAYENIYLPNNRYWTMENNYYKEWELQLWGNYQDKFQKIFQHNFSLTNQKVLFDLQPRNQHEFEVWVEYLKYFEKEKKCSISLISNQFSTLQSFFPLTDKLDNTYYAGYLVNWSDNRMINPYGNNFNAFDLINNKLLRI